MNKELKETVLKHYVEGCVERVLISKSQLEYRIIIACPKEAPPANGYPVIYTLDGDATFNTLAEAARLQIRKPHGYDPAVIVGISYPSREPFDMKRRCYDFTTPAEAGNLPVRPNGEAWPERGGADAFLDFIETELKPEIAGEYPVDPRRQTIFGHSLGGLFVLHALFNRPQSFQTYVAGSPSIWWNNHALLQERDTFESKLLRAADKPRLMLTIGADELAHMVEDAEHLVASLQSLELFHTEFVKFPEEGHISVLPATLSRLLKFALASNNV